MHLQIYLNMYSLLMFIPMIFITTSLIFISNSWLSNWMIMEFNLISFLSLIIFEKKSNSEITMNYFLIQSFNSYLFLASSFNLNFLNMNYSNIIYIIMNFSMLTKMGLPPFYMWYLKIMNNLNWNNLFLMTTIQKIIPLMIINMINSQNNLIYKLNFINIIFMSMILSLVGIQSMNLKTMMAFSSMIQMSWMMTLMYINEIMMMNYFMLYMLINLPLTNLFKMLNLNYLNDLNLIKFNDKWMFLMTMFSIFSLASIPPSMGFLMKWISIQSIWKSLSFMFIFLLIINSLISMYFYLRIMYISMFNNSISKKMNFIKINHITPLNSYTLIMKWTSITFLLIYEFF